MKGVSRLAVIPCNECELESHVEANEIPFLISVAPT